MVVTFFCGGWVREELYEFIYAAGSGDQFFYP